jgi:hypothetical protein
MGVAASWRTPDGRILVDDITDEDGVACRIYAGDGRPLAELATEAAAESWFSERGLRFGDLERVPLPDDEECE